MSERQGVEIDYCPQCRGVWLDRGELDKIIEKSQTHTAPTEQVHTHSVPQHQEHYKKPYKKESFLSELFDF